MKFSEFKQAMQRHNEIVVAINKAETGKAELLNKLVECNDVLYNFYYDNLKTYDVEFCNLDAFDVGEEFLLKKLQIFIKKNPKSEIAQLGCDKVWEELAAVFAKAEAIRLDKDGPRYPIWHSLGRLYDDKLGFVRIVSLIDLLDFEKTRYGEQVLFTIPNIEEFLWQVAEECFNKQISKQIGLLNRTRNRIALRRAKVEQQGNDANKIAQLNAKDEKTNKIIEALKTQLD